MYFSLPSFPLTKSDISSSINSLSRFSKYCVSSRSSGGLTVGGRGSFCWYLVVRGSPSGGSSLSYLVIVLGEPGGQLTDVDLVPVCS